MILYKFTPNLKIAEIISVGIFRFYELTKYIKMEDKVGRSDSAECSVSFPRNEYEEFPNNLPTGSFKGVEFKCISMKPGDEYVRQYFVFCMSTEINRSAIGDSKYVVELYRDNFELFSQLLNESENESSNSDGNRFFSHGHVEYYDIHNHPTPIVGERWREAYLKHSDFEYQNEYRAALFASDYFFDRALEEPMVIERNIFTKDGEKMTFNLKLSLSSGIDEDGWRYVEFDIFEFAANMSPEKSKVTSVAGNLEQIDGVRLD